MRYPKIEDLKGQTLTNVRQIEGEDGDEILFVTPTQVYRMYHAQDCCESVRVEDICGDLSDLVYSPILQAEVETNNQTVETFEHMTWTFYKFATNKGAVTIRWLGESNGYYSEEVDLEVIEVKK